DLLHRLTPLSGRTADRRLLALSWSASRPRSVIGSCGTRKGHSHVDRAYPVAAYGAVPGTRRRLTMPALRSSHSTYFAPWSASQEWQTPGGRRHPAAGQTGMAGVPGPGTAAGPVNRQVHDSAACVLVFRVVRDGRDQARQLRLSPAIRPYGARD